MVILPALVALLLQAGPITAPPESIKAKPFYKKYLNCGGLPIMSSEKVADEALRRAAGLIDRIVADRPDVRPALVEANVRFVIIGSTEVTTDIPEYSRLRPKEFINKRTRGYGGRMTSCGEENLLCLPDDRYDDESILIHEFAHVMHGFALRRIDEDFEEMLQCHYATAMEKRLWKNAYASVNHHEYWAEGVQCWYDANRENNWNHNHVNTREELKAYDPDLAGLIEETLRHTEMSDWRYAPPVRRPQVTPPPPSAGAPARITKCVRARGFLVLGSDKVSDGALLEANRVIRETFAYRHDVLSAMIDGGVRLVILAEGEDPAGEPLTCPASDLFGAPEAPSILIHRMALAVHRAVGRRPVDPGYAKRRQKQTYEQGLERLDVEFDRKLEALNRNAKGTTGRAEYWAAGVQSWLGAGRETLQSTDPALARFIAGIFKHTERTDWRYKRVGRRE